MPKFLVYVDQAKPYEVDYPSAMSATIAALDKHPSADRVEVKPPRQAGREPVLTRRRSDVPFDRKWVEVFNLAMASEVRATGRATLTQLKAMITPEETEAAGKRIQSQLDALAAIEADFDKARES